MRVVRGLQVDDRVELWRGGEFCEIRRFEINLQDVLVDAGRDLLVRLEDGEVWSLAADDSAWSRVGAIPVPR